MQSRTKVHVLAVAVIAVSLTACVAPGTYRPNTDVSKTCTNGSVVVEIKYGDSYVQVTPKADLRRNAGVKFVLKPKKNEQAHKKGSSKDTEDLLVTIKGEDFVHRGERSGGVESVTWLDISGTAGPSPHDDLIVCADPDQASGTYFYSVEVENVGKLDPRADVMD